MSNLTKQPTDKQFRVFYGVAALFWLVAVLWLSWTILRPGDVVEVCMVKHIYGIPCPSCGTSRSINALLHGDLQEAAMLNPLGFPALMSILIFPFFWLSDVLRRHHTLWHAYQYVEHIMRKPVIAIAFFGIMATLWIWNIIKGI